MNRLGGRFWLIEEQNIIVVSEHETGLRRGLSKAADAASHELLGSLWEGSPSSPQLAALLPFSPARQRISLRPRLVRRSIPLAGLDSSSTDAAIGTTVGKRIPDFDMVLNNGITVSTGRLIGECKPTFLFFFATW